MDDPTKIAQDVFDKSLSDSQYGVSPVPYHTHNGTDSPLIQGVVNSLNSETGNISILAGTNTSVTPSGTNITIANTSTAKAVDYQDFATAGTATWTKPAGVTANSLVYIQMWGAGGGGSGTDGTVISAATAGGGAEYAEIFILASALNSTVGLTVGTGGTGGVGNASGSDGTSSKFPTSLPLVTARGGNKGTYQTPSGAGGGYFGGAANSDARDANSGGGGGSPGGAAFKGGGGGSGGNPGGNGGVSQFGGNGGVQPSGNGNGGAGFQPGGGGAGAVRNTFSGTNQTGGQGGDGEVRIWTIF